jgi:plasmid maintenance system antidote protein VapI
MAAHRQLTPGQVQIIRSRYVIGCRKDGAASVAKAFGVSPNAIRDIVDGRSYRDAPSGHRPVSEDDVAFVRRWLVAGHKERGWNAFARVLGIHPKVLRVLVRD